MECKEETKLNTEEICDSNTTEELEDVVEESSKAKQSKRDKNVSRRGLLGGAAAAVIVGAGGAVAVPLLSNAGTGDADPATKDDISKLEYELSLLKNVSDDAELISHKTEKIDETSTDVQYPSSKAVFSAMSDKIDIKQGEEYAGFIFIVGDDGKLKLSKFTSDELSETETLPVENRVIYKEIKDILRALDDLDEVPVKDSTRGVESGGVYKTFQETAKITDFKTVEMGVNYQYTGDAITDDEDAVFSVRRFDNVYMAISESDPSLIYTSVDGGTTWGAPYGGW